MSYQTRGFNWTVLGATLGTLAVVALAGFAIVTTPSYRYEGEITGGDIIILDHSHQVTVLNKVVAGKHSRFERGETCYLGAAAKASVVRIENLDAGNMVFLESKTPVRFTMANTGRGFCPETTIWGWPEETYRGIAGLRAPLGFGDLITVAEQEVTAEYEKQVAKIEREAREHEELIYSIADELERH